MNINEYLFKLEELLFDETKGVCANYSENNSKEQAQEAQKILDKIPMEELSKDEYIQFCNILIQYVAACVGVIGEEKEYNLLFYKMYDKLLASSYYSESDGI